MIQPAYIRGNGYWYRSPFREERTPSFKVNSRLNVWFDHGTWEGGTIIDLAAKIHQCTYQEATEKLTNGNYQKVVPLVINKKIERPDNKIEIIGTNPITDPRLINYLKHRCIGLELAKKTAMKLIFPLALRPTPPLVSPTGHMPTNCATGGSKVLLHRRIIFCR